MVNLVPGPQRDRRIKAWFLDRHVYCQRGDEQKLEQHAAAVAAVYDRWQLNLTIPGGLTNHLIINRAHYVKPSMIIALERLTRAYPNDSINCTKWLDQKLTEVLEQYPKPWPLMALTIKNVNDVHKKLDQQCFHWDVAERVMVRIANPRPEPGGPFVPRVIP